MLEKTGAIVANRLLGDPHLLAIDRELDLDALLVERDNTELERPFHPLEGNDVPTGDGTPRQRDAGEGE